MQVGLPDCMDASHPKSASRKVPHAARFDAFPRCRRCAAKAEASEIENIRQRDSTIGTRNLPLDAFFCRRPARPTSASHVVGTAEPSQMSSTPDKRAVCSVSPGSMTKPPRLKRLRRVADSDDGEKEPAPPREGIEALLLQDAAEAVRVTAESLLHKAFVGHCSQRSISQYLGLRSTSPESEGSRIVGVEGKTWLLLQRVAGCVVAAALLKQQIFTNTGPAFLRGGMVLEYIASCRSQGGQAHLLVSAACDVTRSEGFSELFSACDLSQTGHAFGGEACAAEAAHRRWGFDDIKEEEWQYRRFIGYSVESHVRFMVKPVDV